VHLLHSAKKCLFSTLHSCFDKYESWATNGSGDDFGECVWYCSVLTLLKTSDNKVVTCLCVSLVCDV